MSFGKSLNMALGTGLLMLASVWILCWAFETPFSIRLVVALMVIFSLVGWLVVSSTAVVLIIVGAVRKAEDNSKREALHRSAKNVLDLVDRDNVN